MSERSIRLDVGRSMLRCCSQYWFIASRAWSPLLRRSKQIPFGGFTKRITSILCQSFTDHLMGKKTDQTISETKHLDWYLNWDGQVLSVQVDLVHHPIVQRNVCSTVNPVVRTEDEVFKIMADSTIEMFHTIHGGGSREREPSSMMGFFPR